MTFLVLSNLALNKMALSSSNFPDGISSPSNVVDGNFDTNYYGTRSCFSTDVGDQAGNAWWAVDLEAPYNVQYVVVTNREDGGSKCVLELF
jgi:F5/8 type C domain